MKSYYQKIMVLEGLLETDDLNEWEHGFVENIVDKVIKSGLKDTTFLTEKQLACIDKIYSKFYS